MTKTMKIGLTILLVPIVFLWAFFSYDFLRQGFIGIQGEGIVTNSERTSSGAKTSCRYSVKVTNPVENGGVISGVGTGPGSGCYKIGQIVPVVVTSNRQEMGIVGTRNVILLKGIAIFISLPALITFIYLIKRHKKLK